eukprot:121351-Rhodomonas_salina.4
MAVWQAVLFTKKSETPALWTRVAASFGGKMQFGEVRLEQVALMQQFGMTEDALPKVVAIRVNLDNSKQKVLYEGPNDFDKIREFLSDIAEGGPVVVELKKQVEVLQREAKGLKAELMHEHVPSPSHPLSLPLHLYTYPHTPIHPSFHPSFPPSPTPSIHSPKLQSPPPRSPPLPPDPILSLSPAIPSVLSFPPALD